MISFSVALAPDKGIGIKGSLPWHIKEELQLFRSNTMGKHILMGQTTYDNLPNKLNGRNIIVVSSDPDYVADGAETIHDLLVFLKQHQNDETEYIICGGASIYNQSYQYAYKAYVSFIKKEYETDTKFNEFDLNDWQIQKETEYTDFVYRELIRKERE